MKANNKSVKKEIQDIFKNSPNKDFNYKQIAALLDINSSKGKTISKNLELLKDEGFIQEVKKGKFKLRNVKNTVVGVIDFTEKRNPFVFSEEMKEKIYVPLKYLNHALHKDTVEVSVFAKSKSNNIEGEVIKIIKRSNQTFVGTIAKSENFAFLVVDNKLMPVDIFIPINKLKGAKHGEKAIVKISDWPEYAKNPVGEVIEVLGKAGEHNVEMNAILIEFGLPHKFPENVDKEAEKISTEITEKEIKSRKDYRDVFTITIDPADAKDFDDAISFKKLDNGNYEIGIHIADVTQYVKEGSIIDREGEQRATSVYLVDRVIPMLPEKLSNDVCSLNEHTDKLTFSVIAVLDVNAQVKKTWIGRTIINSNKRFNYEEVQEIIEKKEGLYADELIILNELAQRMRRKRLNNGAIAFDRGELRFKIDKEGLPLEVLYKKPLEANQLIEEFMLLANKAVAEFVGKVKPDTKPKTFVYRVHDHPDFDKLKVFQNFISKFGYDFSLKSDKAIAKSFNDLFVQLQNKPEADVLANFAIRAMARAVYTTQNIGHYGLGFNFYTHFTSPIRRYPDMMVHRLLEKYLRDEPSVNEKVYEAKCEHSSEMEQMAMSAERASIKYKAVEYMKDKIGQTFDGFVSGISEWGMFVEIIPYKIEGTILLRDIANDFFYFDEENYTLIAHYSEKKYQIGDQVKIKVVRADLMKRQLDFQLITY